MKKKRKGAPKGNNFWELRSKHGVDKLFATPELMMEAAMEYFQWCVDNPMYNLERGKDDKIIKLEVTRPFTFAALCLYLGCSVDYFRVFKATQKDKPNAKGFLMVISWIEQTMYSQKFNGAAVGHFNANIISRDLGLVDKTEAKTEAVVLNVTPTPEETKKIRKALEKNI